MVKLVAIVALLGCLAAASSGDKCRAVAFGGASDKGPY
jgi:hypothetical protein